MSRLTNRRILSRYPAWFAIVWIITLLWPIPGTGMPVAAQPEIEQPEPDTGQMRPDFSQQRLFGPGNDWTSSVALGDLDGDGDLDIVVGNTFGNDDRQNALYLNDGTGNFLEKRIFGPGNDNTTSVALGDLDGDGDLDIATGNRDEQNVVYLNNGIGRFYTGDIVCGSTDTIVCFGSGNDPTTRIALGDMNGDGSLDIVVGNGPLLLVGGGLVDVFQNLVYLNDGSGRFPDTLTRPFGTSEDRTIDLALADLDGDNALDIVVGNIGQSAIYLNDGNGSFPAWRQQDLGEDHNRTLSVAVGDLNNDGHYDIVTSAGFREYTVYLNNADQPGTIAETITFAFDRRQTGEIFSMALGDLDNDGRLDIVTGNDVLGGNGRHAGVMNIVFFNTQPPDSTQPITFAAHQQFGVTNMGTQSVALGDLNNDSRLDIVTGNSVQNMAFLNTGPGHFGRIRSFGNQSSTFRSAAVGDLNNDGYLDIATGSSEPVFRSGDISGQNRVYLNNGSGDFPSDRSTTFGSDNDGTAALAIGDMDSDGDLDIVAGNVPQYTQERELISGSGQNMVYLNDGSGRFSQSRPFGQDTDSTTSLALGDLDADGDLDIVAVNEAQTDTGRIMSQSQIYLNDGRGTFDTERSVGSAMAHTTSIALGDLDGDNDLDIVAGNAPWGSTSVRNVIYLNNGSGTFIQRRMFGADDHATSHISLGDIDADGDLDIVTGNYGQRNLIYLNDGQGNVAGAAAQRDFGTMFDATYTVAVADMDNDSDLDIITGNDASGEQSFVYLNDGRGNFPFAERRASGPEQNEFTAFPNSLVIGDLDNDGDRDIITLRFDGTGEIAFNERSGTANQINNPPQVTIARPGLTPAADFFSTTTILTDQVIPVAFTLRDPEGDHVGSIRAFYSLDGGGQWHAAIATAETSVHNLATSPDGVTHTFNWDTFASQFFGQSDNVLLRIEAYPVPLATGRAMPGSYRYPYSVANQYARPYSAATTAPFRVRGTQVRVLAAADDSPVADAVVYHLAAGQQRGAEILSHGPDQPPYRTDANGYLRGQSTLAISDTLMAMLPISYTQTYTLFHTSAAPISTTLAFDTISQPGIQTLRVSPASPLLLLNLDVSLEWDARTDLVFMNRLRFDLQRSSELLYDWTNGQVALGDLRVYHDKQHWDDAHIRIYATNVLRPNANQGGIVTRPISETVTIDPITRTITYEPGQVRMGFVWNRSGEADSNPSEDWARALAHELGHYALFLDDNYLGLDAAGRLVAVDGCPGAMSNPYRDRYSEFHPAASWLPACERTLSQQNSGRSDWETITAHYPALQAPPAEDFSTINPGPSGLPVEVTRITFIEPVRNDDSQALTHALFYLSQNGASFQPGPNARAYLFQNDRLIDLGRPILDQIEAHGAHTGDRICLFEVDAGRLGCTQIQPSNDQLAIFSVNDWRPDVIVTPVTSSTIAISVTDAPAGLTLKARLYPISVAASRTLTNAITLTETGTVYHGDFTTSASAPVLGGYVHVWAEAADPPRREVVTNFTLGGNPAPLGVDTRPRNQAGAKRGRPSPVTSADGQVILFGADLDFPIGEFYILQEAVMMPQPPPWASIIGRTYRLSASANAPDLKNTSISIGYLEGAVPPGEEQWLRVYFWHPTRKQWQQLPTSLNPDENMASAPTQGAGLYALMSSIQIELPQAGWNPIGYPVRASRPVATALASIEGNYNIVYGYDINDPQDPWKVHATNIPAPFASLVNDLPDLQFAQSYWISTTIPLTLSLLGNTAPVTISQPTAISSGMPVIPPPATYYGEVIAGSGAPPQPDWNISITLADGTPCAESRTQQVGDMIGYVITIPDQRDRASACSVAGQRMNIQLNGQTLARRLRWNNDQIHRLTLVSTTGNPSRR